MTKKAWVYDYETIQNCFLAVYINLRDPKDSEVFEVSDFRNDYTAFLTFLKDLAKQKNFIVSYNGLNFDSQVAIFCLKKEREFSKLSGGEIARSIFKFVQEMLLLRDEKGWNMFRPSENPFNECDLAAINNYNNKAKFASLKWLQYNMDYPNIIDMDCQPEDILNQKEIFKLRRYCFNDCYSTRKLFFLNTDQVKVRKDLSKHFGLPLFNNSEPKLAKDILLKLLSEDLNISPNELKQKRTFRNVIPLSEIILPYIKFTTSEFKKTLIKFKNLRLKGEDLKGSFNHEMMYRGLPISFALGGIHGAKKGDYVRTEGMIIKSLDVKSYYPNLVIQNRWSPAHMDTEIFCNRYVWFYEERLKYSKKNPLNYLFKIILNSVYGLSNDKHSFLKDSLLTMQVTCNGQLSLCMLLEELCERIPGARPLMINTDGGEIMFPKEYEDLYFEICKAWEELTKLELEFEEYERLSIWDVNNYVGIFKPKEVTLEYAKELYKEHPKPLLKQIDGKILHYPVKCKGRFEVDKALHKNKSFRIKRLALYNYFVLGISPEDTLKQSKNILDYCAGSRAKGGWKFHITNVSKGNLIESHAQKTLRYFVAHSGVKITKRKTEILIEDKVYTNKKGVITKTIPAGTKLTSIIKLEAGPTYEELLLRHDPKKKFEDYNINFDFYLAMIYKEIESLTPLSVQQTLF